MCIKKLEKKAKKDRTGFTLQTVEGVEVQPYLLILKEKGSPPQNTLKSSGAFALGALLSIWNLFLFTEQNFWLLNRVLSFSEYFT